MQRKTPFNIPPKALAIASGIMLGVGLGVTFGVALKNPLLGIGLGLCFGISMTTAQLAALKKQS